MATALKRTAVAHGPAGPTWRRVTGPAGLTWRSVTVLAALAFACALPAAVGAQAVLPGDEPNGPYPGYWSWPDIVLQLHQYERDYPDLVRVQSIGRSWEGRDILVVRITKDPHTDDASKPEVLFLSGIHPREQAPQISVMRFMDELITGYGSDERITRLLDTRDLWVIPVYNVDGKVYDFKFGNGQTRGANWRTSRQPFGPDTFGIDLNRNGLVGWGSASWTPGAGTYHGPGPLSAPESQALFDFMASRRFRLFLDIHSTTRAYLMPGPKIREDADIYRYLTNGMQARQREPYRGTVGRNESESGANSGTGVGQTHVTGLYVHGAISYILELGPANFYAPPDSIVAHYERNVREPYFFLLEEAINLPVRQEGEFRLVDAQVSGPLTPGARVEWTPKVEGDVAYGVLVSRTADIRVTGEYRLHPLRAGGHILNVAEDAVPGTEVPLQLYLWDRGRRRSVVDITVTVAAPPQSAAQPATGTRGMVSSGHPIATQAGLDVLQAGGTAFDAAVAIAAALGVVEPMMSGVGGYGTVMIWDAAARRARFLNPSGRIPHGVDSDAFRAPTPGYMENRRGAKAVSTPGNVNAWEAMWREYGTRPWATLFDAAITAAESGFVVGPRNAGMIATAFADFPAHARAFYGRDGRPLGATDTLVQRDLGRTLRLIADQGAGVVHGGSVGVLIDRAMRDAGGFLALADLRANEAEWWDPIEIEYRGYRVLTASPPANAFDALVRLGIMSRFDVRAMGHNSAAYLHHFAEATKHGFWVRLRWAGDPDIAPPPLATLLSDDYFASQAALIDPHAASRFVPPGVVGEAGVNTTHFVVADEWGNIVSATQTLGNAFGARIMPEGTGVWLNNSLAYSTFEPKGNPMDAHAGRRKLSGDVPMLLFRGDRAVAALGTPGGHTIGQTMPQIVMNLVDFGMDIQRAIAAPRVSFAEPDRLLVESGIGADVRSALAALGHELRDSAGIGAAHGLTIEYGDDGRPARFVGGADPRGAGLARGW
jgi:gamma-glutamyltranspeptidase / glutathione hydrolase